MVRLHTREAPSGDVPAGGVSPGPARVSDHVEGPSCDGQRDHGNGSRGRTQHTMALDQSALLQVLQALKAAEVDDRIRSAAATIHQALNEAADGHREVLGFAGGDSEDGAFWTAFLRSLKARGP